MTNSVELKKGYARNLYRFPLDVFHFDKRTPQGKASLEVHPGCEVLCFVGGVGSYQIGDNIIPLERFTVLTFDAQVPHGWKEVNFDHMYAVHVLPKFLWDSRDRITMSASKQLFEAGRHYQKICPSTTISADLLLTLRSLHREFNSEQWGRTLALRNLVRQLLILLVRVRIQDPLRRRKAIRSGDIAQEVIPEICTLVDSNPAANLSVSELARNFHINRSYLSRCFKAVTGSTVSNYVRQRRIELAKVLLSTTNLTVGQIAGTSGFADQAHFTRVFRSMEGVSPLQYRLATQRRLDVP